MSWGRSRQSSVPHIIKIEILTKGTHIYLRCRVSLSLFFSPSLCYSSCCRRGSPRGVSQINRNIEQLSLWLRLQRAAKTISSPRTMRSLMTQRHRRFRRRVASRLPPPRFSSLENVIIEIRVSFAKIVNLRKRILWNTRVSREEVAWHKRESGIRRRPRSSRGTACEFGCRRDTSRR